VLTEMIYLTDGGELEGPKHEFYYLWDQNKNWKLFEGPNDLLSHNYTTLTSFFETVNIITRSQTLKMKVGPKNTQYNTPNE